MYTKSEEAKRANFQLLETRKLDQVALVAASIVSKGSKVEYEGKRINTVDGEEIGYMWRIETESPSSHYQEPTKIYAVISQKRRNQLFKQRKDNTLDVEKIADALIELAKSIKQTRQNMQTAMVQANVREVSNTKLKEKFPSFFGYGKFRVECGYSNRDVMKLTITNLTEEQWETLFALLKPCQTAFEAKI